MERSYADRADGATNFDPEMQFDKDIEKRDLIISMHNEFVAEPVRRCGMEPSEAAHVRYASAAHGMSSGLARKPPDRLALPLCAGCHRLDRNAQHQGGERDFWLRLGIDPHLVCERLYAQRGDGVAMRAVAMVAIAERSRA